MSYDTFKFRLTTLASMETLRRDFLSLAREICIDLPSFDIHERHALLHDLIILSAHAQHDVLIKSQLSALCHQVMITPSLHQKFDRSDVPLFLTHIDLEQYIDFKLPLPPIEDAYFRQELQERTGLIFSQGKLFIMDFRDKGEGEADILPLPSQNTLYPVSELEKALIPLSADKGNVCIFPNINKDVDVLCQIIACTNVNPKNDFMFRMIRPREYSYDFNNSEKPWEPMQLDYLASEIPFIALDTFTRLQQANLLTEQNVGYLVKAVQSIMISNRPENANNLYYAINVIADHQSLSEQCLDMLKDDRDLDRTRGDWLYYRFKEEETSFEILERDYHHFLTQTRYYRCASTLLRRIFPNPTQDDQDEIDHFCKSMTDRCEYDNYALFNLQNLLRRGLLDQANCRTMFALPREKIIHFLCEDLFPLHKFSKDALTKEHFNAFLEQDFPGMRMFAFCKVKSWDLPSGCQTLATQHPSAEFLKSLHYCPPLTEPQLYAFSKCTTLFRERASALESLFDSHLLTEDNVKVVLASTSNDWLKALKYKKGLTQRIFEKSKSFTTHHNLRITALALLNKHNLLISDYQEIITNSDLSEFLDAIGGLNGFFTEQLFLKLHQCPNTHKLRVQALGNILKNRRFTSEQKDRNCDLILTTTSQYFIDVMAKFRPGSTPKNLQSQQTLDDLLAHPTHMKLRFKALELISEKGLLDTHRAALLNDALSEATLHALSTFDHNGGSKIPMTGRRLDQWLVHPALQELLDTLKALPDALLTEANLDVLEHYDHLATITIFLRAIPRLNHNFIDQDFFDQLHTHIPLLNHPTIITAHDNLPWGRKNRVFYAEFFAFCRAQQTNTLQEAQAAIRQYLDPQMLQEVPHRPALGFFNPGQSTHTQSIHRSASQSANALNATYTALLQEKGGVDAVLTEINVDEFDNNDATNALHHLKADYGQYVDQDSVSLRTLLALCWLAIHDHSRCIGVIEDAKIALVYGLQDIATLSNGGFVCQPGAFNKLVEIMAGRHPDVTFVYVRQATVAYKFKAELEAAVRSQLNTRVQQITNQDALNDFRQQVIDIEATNILPKTIWDTIQVVVADTVWSDFTSSDAATEARDAFLSYYPSRTGQAYQKMIQNIQENINYDELIQKGNYHVLLTEKERSLSLDEGVKHLPEGLQDNKNLQLIDLRGNKISAEDEPAKALATNDTLLKVRDLCNNKQNYLDHNRTIVGYKKPTEEIIKEQLSDIINRLKINISTQQNGRKTDWYSDWKVGLLAEIENRLKNEDPKEISCPKYIEDIREICAKKRNTLHFWANPHSVDEFEKMIEGIDWGRKHAQFNAQLIIEREKIKDESISIKSPNLY